MIDNNINSSCLPSFIPEFAKAIIEALTNQFSDSEIYNSLRIFDPKFLLQKEQIMEIVISKF